MMKRHLEDLDNRGRRHNIRIQGLPEAVEQPQLEQTMIEFFNILLDRPPETPNSMERIHRSVWPAPGVNKPPRDVVY